jgi:hypothetical protein
MLETWVQGAATRELGYYSGRIVYGVRVRGFGSRCCICIRSWRRLAMAILGLYTLLALMAEDVDQAWNKRKARHHLHYT